jgi:integrase/recombinase XerD
MKKPALQSPLLDAYREYLLEIAGLTNGTCELYVWHVANFLRAKYGERTVNPKTLRPTNFIRYIKRLSGRYKPSSRKAVVTALRSFLRWLEMEGLCPPDLIKAVSSVSSTKLSGLPVGLSDAELAAFLDSFNRSKPGGLRGYAAALCMVRLGFRVGEVARLTLDDIDWREGTVKIATGKARHANILPLTREVGEAIADYLRKGRPRTKERHIFVCRYPRKGHATGTRPLAHDMRQAFKRAGVNTHARGTRALRQTAATQLIQKGATLKEIADVLGHRSIDTTAIYTKVDYPTLREVAMPWPEVTP